MTTAGRVTAAATLLFYTYSVFLPAWADNIATSASAGNAAAQEAMSAWSPPSVSGNSISYGSGADTQSINISELFPGAGSSGGASDLSNLYGDDNGTLSAGASANTALNSENSVSGDAYRLLKNTAGQTRPDLKNDPLWTNSDNVIDNQEVFNKEFSDCKQITDTRKTTTTKHVSELKTCERVADKSGSFLLKHDYLAGVIKYVSGPTNIQTCGEGCVDIWLGQVGDDYWNGYCTIYENEMQFEVIKPEAIIDAKLTYAKWDDYMQVLVGGTKIWSGPNGNFPPETGGKCELGTSWAATPNVDMTSLLKTSGVVPFKIRASVTGQGEAYAKLRVHFDPTKVISDDRWYPQAALDALTNVSDGACEGNYVCTKMPSVSADGCAVINGVTVCESNFVTSPVPGISPLCQEVSIDTQCNFYKGPMECYTDAQGQQQCPVNTDKICSVNHDLKVIEVPFAAKVAVEDKAGANETNRIKVDFVAGTFTNTSSSLRSDSSLDKVNFDQICKVGPDGRPLPQKIAVSSIGIWTGHKYAPNTLTVDSANIVQMPSCQNGLQMIADIKDTGSGNPCLLYTSDAADE